MIESGAERLFCGSIGTRRRRSRFRGRVLHGKAGTTWQANRLLKTGELTHVFWQLIKSLAPAGNANTARREGENV
jgi:hypothetical protein